MVGRLVLRIVKVVAVLWVIIAGLWTYYRSIHETKLHILTAFNISSPARTDIGVACIEGRYRGGVHNEDPSIGLQAPGDYEFGRVRSVTVASR
jgi:hypothetical protein